MPTKAQLEDKIETLTAALSVIENDNTFYSGQQLSGLYPSRSEWDRQKIFAECLRAWRVNPMARRIVELTTQFVIGDGIAIEAKHRESDKYLKKWWAHPLNDLDEQVPEWSDELTRSGNLFILFSVDSASGMSFVRAVPADLIKEIQTRENDIRQETYFIPHNTASPTWEAWTDSGQENFMMHFAVNRVVGNTWGDSDLAPLLVWLGRFASWLEDRVRLNHFRSAFMYVVNGKFTNKLEKEARRVELNINPPQPGSVLVTDESEQWGILSANLDAFDSSVDGLSIKKMIATGAGIPLHYLAEPESSTRTTSEAAGTPTFRKFETRQHTLAHILETIAHTALVVRKEHDHRINPDAKINIIMPDITERDNTNLALAASRAESAFADLFDREIIDAQELARLTYRMIDEKMDVSKIGEGIRKPLKAIQPGATPANIPADIPAPPASEKPVDEASNGAQ